jgi:hypothetical protein
MDMEQGKGAGLGQHRGPDVGGDVILYVPVDEVKVGARHRKDLGDIEGLARSIREIGLLHPIVARPDGVLIAGERRLAAYKHLRWEELGWDEIPVRVVDLNEVIVGEFAENSCRKDFSPSELVAIGRAMQELEREKARLRQVELGKSHGSPSGKFPEGSNGQTRDKVAAALGISGRTYEKAAQIVQAADKEPERFGHLVEEMDRTGKVDGAYRKLLMTKEDERLLGPDGPAEEVAGAADANAEDGFEETVSADAAPSMDAKSVSAASKRMRLPRIPPRGGMRRVTIFLGMTKVNALVRKGFLPHEQRHDRKAVRGALVQFLSQALEEPRDV